MDPNAIVKRTKDSNKSYNFDESHNPRLPAEYWFQHTIEGETLFIVFYTQACRYSKCEGCNLPSKMSLQHVDYKHIMKQIHMVFHNILSSEKKKSLKKIIVSNNGSVLDEDTFSTTALIYLIAKINLECPNVEVVTLETRPEYVDMEELEVLARALREGDTPSALEIAIGFEAYDDTIRNDHFKKSMSLKQFEDIVIKMSDVNKRFDAKFKHQFKKMRLKTYFMLKPVPEMDETDAVVDIRAAIRYLNNIATEYDIDINMHLNPTYVAVGTELETAFNEGRYTPPQLKTVVTSIIHAADKNITIFVGLNDEDLTIEGGSFIREGDKDLIAALDEFNYTQNYELLKPFN